MFIIEDGRGTGKKAGVTDDFRLQTATVTQATIGNASLSGNAFSTSVPFRTITTTGGNILYVKNTESAKNLIVSKLYVGWDGGSTNNDTALFGTLYTSVSEPSANETASALGNLNLGSGNVASADVYYWDETGDGMTIASATPANFVILGRGMSVLDINDSLVIGPGNSVSFHLRAQEQGEASIICSFSLLDVK